VRRKRGNRTLVCSGCGRRVGRSRRSTNGKFGICHDSSTARRELYRCVPGLRVKAEKVAQQPSKAPFSKRFADAVGLACESTAVRRVARQFG
jgi:hypothetical protein